MAAATASHSRSTTSRGVPVGASRPIHDTASKPGTPASATVGTSGKIGGRERTPILPDVPTVAEAGVPGFEAVSWIGLLAPTGTPREVVERLWDAVAAAMKDGAVKKTLLDGGSEIVVSTPQEFRAVIESDYARYAKLADVFKS